MSSRVRVHLVGGGELTIVHEPQTIEDLALGLCRYRCLIGDLIQEGSEALGEPVRILVPSQRIHLIAVV